MSDESYEGVTHAGLALVAADTGYVLLAQRTLDDTDDEDVRETWEFPGGSLEDGEEPWDGAKREFAEELGMTPPEGAIAGGWRSEDQTYQGFIYQIPYEMNLARWQPTDEVQAAAWFNLDEIVALGDKLRPEVREQMDWELIFGEEALAASGWGAPSGRLKTLRASDDDELTVEFTEDDAFGALGDEDYDRRVPVHGSLVAFDVVTAGATVAYPSEGTLRHDDLPLPVRFEGPDGVVAAGVITALERSDDDRLMYDGYLDVEDDESEAAEEIVSLLIDFGRLGIKPEIGDVREAMVDEESGYAIHTDAKITGAIITASGDFEETYLALGPLKEDPIVAARGPGWATHPRETSRLHRYWTKGPGAAKIRWGTPGDFYRCRRLVGEKIAKNSPTKLRFINRICAQWHHDATGLWTGDRRNPGNAVRASAHVDDTAPITAALSAAGIPALPAEWFEEPAQPEMTFEYDEATGFTRVSGMIAENRRCHIGYGDRCVTPPPGDGKYRLFRKGHIETTRGDILVGALVFRTGHATHKMTLQEAAAHYDNTGHAWAFVNVGNNRQGIWFSGVINPELSEQTIWAIKAGGAVSGDWRWYEGRHEMIAAVSVNVPGYPQPLVAAAYDESGQLLSVTAAGIVLPDRMERVDALRERAMHALRSDRIEALTASAHLGLRAARLDELRANALAYTEEAG